MVNSISIEVLEEKQKVANHRIDKLEEKVEDLTDFKYTVQTLSNTVQDLKITVDKISSQDGNTYKKLKFSVAEKIILLIVAMLFFYLFKFK